MGANSPPQPLPSEDSDAGTFGRQLALLIGPAYQTIDGTRIAAEVLAYGGAIAAARATNLAALAEAFPDSTIQMLPEWESHYGLPVRPELPTTARQQRLLAKVRAPRSAAVQSMLRAIRVLDPTAFIVENGVTYGWYTASMGASFGTGAWGTGGFGGVGSETFVPAEISDAMFVFAVVIQASTWANKDLFAQITAIVQQMKPAYTLGNVPTRVGFRCDDPVSSTSTGSLVDRDALGT